MKRIKQIRKQKSLSSFLRSKKRFMVTLKMSDGSTKEVEMSEQELKILIKRGLLDDDKNTRELP